MPAARLKCLNDPLIKIEVQTVTIQLYRDDDKVIGHMSTYVVYVEIQAFLY